MPLMNFFLIVPSLSGNNWFVSSFSLLGRQKRNIRSKEGQVNGRYALPFRYEYV